MSESDRKKRVARRRRRSLEAKALQEKQFQQQVVRSKTVYSRKGRNSLSSRCIVNHEDEKDG